jgi:predicted amidohydrolase YtcJ
MQHMTASGSCDPSRNPFRTAHLAMNRPTSSGNVEEVRRLKVELARVKRELKELKLATQQFVRSFI